MGVKSISLDYKDSAKRDRYGNRFRYRAKVNGGPNVGPFAYDVFLASVWPSAATRRAAPGSIHVSPPPAPIPDEIVYGFFLRITSCADTDPEVHKHACALAIQKLGLDAPDERTLRQLLAGVYEDLIALDDDIAHAARHPDAENQAKSKNLVSQRHDLIAARIAKIRSRLSYDGQNRLEAYLADMRSRIKFLPQITAPTVAASANLQGGTHE
jgi:hypothetical protein